MRLERLLSITIMLINRRKVTAPELSEHFGRKTPGATPAVIVVSDLVKPLFPEL